MKCQFRDSRGQAIVEMAVVAPLFIVMILGAFEIGRMAYYGIEVENAARAGASYGALNVGYATSTTVAQAAKNDAPNLADMAVTSGDACVCETISSSNTTSFNPSSGTASCTSTTITSCTAESSTSVQSVVSYVTVSTSAAVPFLFRLPGVPQTYTVHGFSALRILAN